MPIESQGTVLKISNGSGTPKNITAITKAAIAKVTSTAHDLTKGQIVTFASVGGMTEINGLTGFILAVETNDFYVDINTTGFTTYTSGGTATPAEWVAIGEVVDFSGPTGSASVIDATHLLSDAKEKLMGLPDEGQFTMSLNRKFSDDGQQICWAARAGRLSKNFQVTFMDTTVMTFGGFVLEFSSGGGVDDKIGGSITVEISGAVDITP